jgi:L-ascorbate metabolism protein UlaG (beta-lactamase superfamily)
VQAPRATITWIGHATVLIEVDGVRLLTDPVLGRRIGPLVRIAPPADDAAIADIDGILLSHLHHDHAHVPSLKRVPGRPLIIGPHGMTAWLGRCGMDRARDLLPGQETTVCGLPITATHAVHGDRRYPLGPRGTPVGFVVRGSASVYFAGDTDLFDRMEELRGAVDVALLPIWGWGPRLPPGHLDPGRAARAAALIEPAVVVPIHWGTLARGWARRPADAEAPVREFARWLAELAPGVELRVLQPGEQTSI